MTYFQRHLEKNILSAAKHFKIILILGARQVGKSTLLKHLYPEVQSFFFDSILDPYHVRIDPDLFLDLHPPPLLLDEVQFVPTLLSAIKRRVDLSSKTGCYFLTGSQNLNMLKTVAETMTGRAALLQLEGLSLMERSSLVDHKESWLSRYLQTPYEFIKEQHSPIGMLPPLHEVMWRGNLPQALALPRSELSLFFTSYIQTYVERDLRLIENVDDLYLFGQFISLLSALTGQEINHSQLGREIGVTAQTAKRWLFALGASYQWREIPPLFNNVIKRVSEKRKGYLTDTGIACHLLRIFSPEDLAIHPSLGAIFETWVVNHIFQLFATCMGAPGVYHWRTHSGAEIDLILEMNGTLFPIEIKCSRHLSHHDLKGFKSFRENFSDRKIAPGIIIHAGEDNYLLNENTLALSWKTL